ncbi:MAG: MbnP family protein [Saprospiraceae bacterium]
MNFKNISLLLFVVFFTHFISCEKNEDNTLQNGSVSLNIDHVFGTTGDAFILNKEYTHPRLNEKMTFNKFRYYISNIKLKNVDGTWYSVPESYYLVDLEKLKGNVIDLKDIPGGEYTDIEWMYGVDSTRNVSGAQTGVLDPVNDMFWSWNTGYIMLKAEGTSPDAQGGSFSFHLGGFKGEYKIQSTHQYAIGKLIVDGDREAEIHMIANPAQLWHAADKLSIKSSQMAPGVVAKTMSSTFYSGVTFDHIHN